jgi:hypothetical protein
MMPKVKRVPRRIAAHAVAQRRAIVPFRPFDRTIARRENNSVAFADGDRLRAGLCARNIFHKNEFNRMQIAALPAEHDHHLKRKSDFAL